MSGVSDIILPLPVGTAALRRATADDLPAILELLADDPIGAAHGDTARTDARPAYERAFAAIDASPEQRLLVATSTAREVIATMQLTLIPGLTRVGASRLQIASVRVRADHRNRGIGRAMVRWAVKWRRSSGRSWSNSPPTRRGSTRTASTNGSDSQRRTWASRSPSKGNGILAICG